MSDINETVKINRPVSGYHVVTITVKVGIATSSYSYKTTQSGIQAAVELCRREALKNLDLAANVKEYAGPAPTGVPDLHVVPPVDEEVEA